MELLPGVLALRPRLFSSLCGSFEARGAQRPGVPRPIFSPTKFLGLNVFATKRPATKCSATKMADSSMVAVFLCEKSFLCLREVLTDWSGASPVPSRMVESVLFGPNYRSSGSSYGACTGPVHEKRLFVPTFGQKSGSCSRPTMSKSIEER